MKNMKKEKGNETMTPSQNGQGIKCAVTELYHFNNGIQPNLRICKITAISAILPAGRGTEQLGRDGPPGRARSPGIIFRKGQHTVPSAQFNTEMNINILIKPKIQLFTNINF